MTPPKRRRGTDGMAGVVRTGVPRSRPIVMAIALALGAPACGSTEGATGVHGRVTAGPTCPVERPDQPCPPNPVAGRVEAIDAAGDTAGSTTTDGTGGYALSLSPGDYTLRVSTEAMFPVCPDTAVSVPAGVALTVDIGCDTGIR